MALQSNRSDVTAFLRSEAPLITTTSLYSHLNTA